MKRCKRCYSIIEKNCTHCPSCGLEVNFKNTYHTNESKKNYYYNGVHNKNTKKNNGKGIIIFVFIFYAVIFFIGVITSIIEEEQIDFNDFDYSINSSDVDYYLTDLKTIAEDYYAIWTISLTNSVSTDMIVEKTSLSYEDLDNSYCKSLSINKTIENAKNCVKSAHINIGTYDDAYNDINYLYDLAVDSYDYGEIEYEILTDIYMHAITLISSINDEDDYSNYEEVYNNTITSIETLLQELDLKTS